MKIIFIFKNENCFKVDIWDHRRNYKVQFQENEGNQFLFNINFELMHKHPSFMIFKVAMNPSKSYKVDGSFKIT